ncbi:Protein of unknown function [Pyronema omphalodes CBS 100304]|uniref:Uncharacterized protein n=1 Tax=Pyronema omphalodes (strain CBS 100304) TaxID=1076935 RepID=U4KYA7_PYROM|nr:Protein of unknown function [Pyronema omphalodes CBS 100304]
MTSAAKNYLQYRRPGKTTEEDILIHADRLYTLNEAMRDMKKKDLQTECHDIPSDNKVCDAYTNLAKCREAYQEALEEVRMAQMEQLVGCFTAAECRLEGGLEALQSKLKESVSNETRMKSHKNRNVRSLTKNNRDISALRKSYLLATMRKIHYIYNEDISSAKWLDHAGRVIPPETMEGGSRLETVGDAEEEFKKLYHNFERAGCVVRL